MSSRDALRGLSASPLEEGAEADPANWLRTRGDILQDQGIAPARSQRGTFSFRELGGVRVRFSRER